ncbi:hypothetical protein [Dolichospermum compactum]|uniref:Uncharacterized protein n=1 Tax=Dolichospermum compactum NIES-806 TaxID=1973481 RepID=A0A1Z4V8C2_9CYAN|nr:hypothetical protein [Dolichospermum compactum]BAZ87816.1 hypothetical protein NIES806_40470 [Dolichospermum compactum NIES-806]
MTPLTKTVVISQLSATQSLQGVSLVYQPLATQSLQGVSHIQFQQKSFGLLNSFGLSKIQELIQNLSNLEGVESVKAVLKNVHSVVFQIKLSTLSEQETPDDFEYEIEVNDSEQIWKEAQDLVLKTCCHLRDITGEKWYFFTQIVEDFTNPLLDS